MNTPPDAILFDWDGTLVNTLPGLRLAHNHVRGLYGLEQWSEDQFMQNIKFSARELYPRIYGDKATEAMDKLYGFVMERHLDHLEILPGAEDLVMFLHGQGIPIGIVSNKRHQVLIRETDHLGWHEKFFCVLGAGMAARDKPWADPVLMALEKCTGPLTPEKVWFVGDSEADLQAAGEAGCPAILITHGRDRQDLIGRFGPMIVTDDCHGLLNILENILGNKRTLAEKAAIE